MNLLMGGTIPEHVVEATEVPSAEGFFSVGSEDWPLTHVVSCPPHFRVNYPPGYCLHMEQWPQSWNSS